ncbi:TetR/AcrR family transcriptional regulator [Acetobacterium wieringae]|uniref:TetR/AcrR family transcriptional regulator n=1 Tax=Acetobacterium wieringae TaxID=52694 RepID=UPI003159403B
MNTKERIVYISLELFAQKGFSGVSVRDIASVVGVRESGLYKHFKNKQDILDSIMVIMKERIELVYQENEVPEVMTEDVAAAYKELSLEKLCEISWNLFSLFTKDPLVSNFRRLLMREKFGNEQIARQYGESYLLGVVRKQGKTFAKLVEGKFFREENPEIIALQFYGPILLLFQQYDCNPENEEQIKGYLNEHIRAFGKNYSRTV